MIDPVEKVISCFLISFLSSTLIIRIGIRKLRPETKCDKDDDNDRDSKNVAPKGLPESSAKPVIFDLKSTGFWIGFCETLLIFAFVYAHELGGLAIIIGAKEFVRKEKIREDPSYFLLGTLINTSLALIFALIAWS
ncbi:MAG: hypothetical protein ACE5NG_05140 [bacterium]